MAPVAAAAPASPYVPQQPRDSAISRTKPAKRHIKVSKPAATAPPPAAPAPAATHTAAKSSAPTGTALKPAVSFATHDTVIAQKSAEASRPHATPIALHPGVTSQVKAVIIAANARGPSGKRSAPMTIPCTHPHQTRRTVSEGESLQQPLDISAETTRIDEAVEAAAVRSASLTAAKAKADRESNLKRQREIEPRNEVQKRERRAAKCAATTQSSYPSLRRGTLT